MKKIYIFISALSLLNVMFVPIFDVWGGLFPSGPDDNFLDVIEMIFTDSNAWHYWVVLLTMSIFIPSIAMFITSFCTRIGFLISSIIGIISVTSVVVWFSSEYTSWSIESLLFDLDDGCVCIGTWIALLIFIIAGLVSLFPDKKKNVESEKHFHNPYENSMNSIDENSVYSSAERYKFCSNCGQKNNIDSAYCNYCGLKF